MSVEPNPHPCKTPESVHWQPWGLEYKIAAVGRCGGATTSETKFSPGITGWWKKISRPGQPLHVLGKGFPQLATTTPVDQGMHSRKTRDPPEAKSIWFKWSVLRVEKVVTYDLGCMKKKMFQQGKYFNLWVLKRRLRLITVLRALDLWYWILKKKKYSVSAMLAYL